MFVVSNDATGATALYLGRLPVPNILDLVEYVTRVSQKTLPNAFA